MNINITKALVSKDNHFKISGFELSVKTSNDSWIGVVEGINEVIYGELKGVNKCGDIIKINIDFPSEIIVKNIRVLINQVDGLNEMLKYNLKLKDICVCNTVLEIY